MTQYLTRSKMWNLDNFVLSSCHCNFESYSDFIQRPICCILKSLSDCATHWSRDRGRSLSSEGTAATHLERSQTAT